MVSALQAQTTSTVQLRFELDDALPAGDVPLEEDLERGGELAPHERRELVVQARPLQLRQSLVQCSAESKRASLAFVVKLSLVA